MADLDSVRVAVRIRPFANYEKERNCKEAVEKTAGQPQVKVNRSDSFTFNYVFDADSTQEEVYTTCVSNMLDKLFEGFNATILAYGQTGSGKTHTMGTHFEGVLNEKVGVIPRAMFDIFERIKQLADGVEFNVKCSFMELYQEQLYDLLSSKGRQESVVDLREDRTGIIIPGLTEETVSTAKETTDFLVKGSAGRAVAATAMNEQSSRSHAIFTVTIQATRKDDVNSVTTSKFHLVDLAGSERSKKTKAAGDRLKEGIKINQGLMVLGKVISALGTGNGNTFVCYRDSKLTRLLQDSLGGNSYTLMIACVSPADYNVDETLSTLRYADNARKIKNKPIVNQDPRMAEINFLKDLNLRLHSECLASGVNLSPDLLADLERLAQGGPLRKKITAAASSSSGGSSVMTTSAASLAANSADIAKLEEKIMFYERKCRQLQQQLQISFHDIAETEMRAHLSEAAHEHLQSKSDLIQNLIKDLKNKYPEDEQILELFNIIHNMNEELQKTQMEIFEHKKNTSLSSEMNDNTENENENYASMQEKAEAFTRKQADLKEQLRRIDRELNLKEELQERVRCNLTKFCSIDQEVESEKVKEFEQKIQDLENEKAELMEKLKGVKKDSVSAKIAEDRRKRLQTLEHEIAEMRRKMTHQAKLLKVREKEAEKIKNLNTEIRSMKESKVKLIKAMRQESDYFRQFKLAREKEVIQLKNKDRKMQSEMARKEALHTKQRNVLKRKCEEAMAVNKRLKDALERQSAAQAQRQKSHTLKAVGHISSNASRLDHIIQTAERELEIITSLVDAKFSLEQLTDDRDLIASRIKDLENSKNASDSQQFAQELTSLKDDLEIRHIQIKDLEQKVSMADLDGRIKGLVESVQNVAEGKIVLKNLIKVICELRRDYDQINQNLSSVIEEHKIQIEASEERFNEVSKKINLMQIEHEQDILDRENHYEDKIAVLLRGLQNSTDQQQKSSSEETTEKKLNSDQLERFKIFEDQLNKMDGLKDELNYYKNLVNSLREASQPFKNRHLKVRVKDEIEEELLSENDFEELESDDYLPNDDKDPDWKETPRFRRKPSNTNRRTTSGVNRSSGSMDESYQTAVSSEMNNNNTSGANKAKRKTMRNGCGCSGNCSSKRCGCFSRGMPCSNLCRCSDDCCNQDGGGSKENMPPAPPSSVLPSSTTISSTSPGNEPDSEPTSPKKAKLIPNPKKRSPKNSILPFAHATPLKKFLDN